jgi:hypothetical protein
MGRRQRKNTPRNRTVKRPIEHNGQVKKLEREKWSWKKWALVDSSMLLFLVANGSGLAYYKGRERGIKTVERAKETAKSIKARKKSGELMEEGIADAKKYCKDEKEKDYEKCWFEEIEYTSQHYRNKLNKAESIVTGADSVIKMEARKAAIGELPNAIYLGIVLVFVLKIATLIMNRNQDKQLNEINKRRHTRHVKRSMNKMDVDAKNQSIRVRLIPLLHEIREKRDVLCALMYQEHPIAKKIVEEIKAKVDADIEKARKTKDEVGVSAAEKELRATLAELNAHLKGMNTMFEEFFEEEESLDGDRSNHEYVMNQKYEQEKELERILRKICGRGCSMPLSCALVRSGLYNKVSELQQVTEEFASYLWKNKQKLNIELRKHGWSVGEVLSEIEKKKLPV